MLLTRNFQHRALLPYTSERVDVSSLVVTLDSNKANDCVEVLIRFEGGDIRSTHDGTTPVSGTTGLLRFAGESQFLSRTEAKLLKLIRDQATDGIVWATYYR